MTIQTSLFPQQPVDQVAFEQTGRDVSVGLVIVYAVLVDIAKTPQKEMGMNFGRV